MCNLQRWLQKLEAIFESAPQVLLQIVFLIKSDDKFSLGDSQVLLVVTSLIVSSMSVSSRFTSGNEFIFCVFLIINFF